MVRTHARLWYVLALCLALAGCKNAQDDKYEEKPVKSLYDSATKNLADSKFKKAAKDYEEVLRQHPYSAYATRAQLMAAYAHYRGGDYEDAVVSADAFIQLHPAHKDVAYAYYLKALCFYNQIESSERDQRMTENALAAFDELTRRFPLSQYAKDAKLKMALTREHLAGSFMDVGRFYQAQKLYFAALGRFKQVVQHYETTSHTPEALYRLVEVYLQLGIIKEAQATTAVLGHNYPGSKWYQKSFNLLQRHNALPSQEVKLEQGWKSPGNAAQPVRP